MRRQYYRKLQEWLASGHKKPLLLRGVRQCGKTYLLNILGQKSFQMFIILILKKPELTKVFESNLDPRLLVNQLSFHQNRPIDVSKDLVIFDEIQAIPRALTSLKYFQEDMPELAFCCAGSLLGVRLNHASYPVGKFKQDIYIPFSLLNFYGLLVRIYSADLIETCNSNSVIPPLAARSHLGTLKMVFYCWRVAGSCSSFY